MSWLAPCASPLAKVRRGPDAKSAQQVPGGNAAGVQPALLLLHGRPQLSIRQRLDWQQRSIMRVAVQDKAIVLCSTMQSSDEDWLTVSKVQQVSAKCLLFMMRELLRAIVSSSKIRAHAGLLCCRLTHREDLDWSGRRSTGRPDRLAGTYSRVQQCLSAQVPLRPNFHVQS